MISVFIRRLPSQVWNTHLKISFPKEEYSTHTKQICRYLKSLRFNFSFTRYQFGVCIPLSTPSYLYSAVTPLLCIMLFHIVSPGCVYAFCSVCILFASILLVLSCYADFMHVHNGSTFTLRIFFFLRCT